MQSIHPLTVRGTDGTERSLAEYEGQVLLIANVASGCGFAPQMKQFEELQQEYGPRGFKVLAFPSNDFFQEARFGPALERQACEIHKITYPIFERLHVRGQEQHPLFERLTDGTGGWLGRPVRWNFEKFLVNRKGQVVARWRSLTSPISQRVRRAIEAELTPKP